MACEARPAIVQSYSQIQARVRFVTSLKMDNFNCLKMMQISKNSQLVYDIGGAHSLVEAYTLLVPPLPLMSVLKQHSFILHKTTVQLSYVEVSQQQQ